MWGFNMLAQIEVFKFQELQGKAKEKAQNWLIEGNDHVCPECAEDFKTELESFGFFDVKVCYSGFYSHGDGASFEGKIGIEKLSKLVETLKENQPKEWETVKADYIPVPAWLGEYNNSVGVHTRGHYCHSNTMVINDYQTDDDGNEWDGEKDFLQICKYLADNFYRDLGNSWDYACKDEQLAETCESNGYLFNERGEPVHNLITLGE